MALNKLFKNIFGGGKKVKKKVSARGGSAFGGKSKKAKVKSAAKKHVRRSPKGKGGSKIKKIKRAVKAKKAAKKISKPAKAGKPAKTAKPGKKQQLKLKKGPQIAYIGIGSNVGDREEYIEQAIFLLSKTPGIRVMKKSTNHESDAVGPGDQQPYLNAAVEIQTTLDPYKLLQIIQDTENALGREREVDWGPRTIDLDILFYGDQIISDDKLQVPHPLMHERLFVLKPLAEIAGKVMHPALERSIESLYEERKSDVGEKYDDELPGFKEIKKGTPDDYERW